MRYLSIRVCIQRLRLTDGLVPALTGNLQHLCYLAAMQPGEYPSSVLSKIIFKSEYIYIKKLISY